MLALHDTVNLYGKVREGTWATIPGTKIRVSPAVAGWRHGSYRLDTVQDPDPVPPGEYEMGRTVQLVNGVPKYVLATAAIPVLTDDERISNAIPKVLIEYIVFLRNKIAILEGNPPLTKAEVRAELKAMLE